MTEELPLVSVYKKEIGWGMGGSRVTSECVTLMAIRPVCILYKHIISECNGMFHYDFIPTGTAAMTTAKQVKELLINNNDIQNSVQGISVMGLPRMALDGLLQQQPSENNRTVDPPPPGEWESSNQLMNRILTVVG